MSGIFTAVGFENWWWGLLLTCYLVGSIPFGWILGRLRGVDLRGQGSGSIGATNAGRSLGAGFGFLTLLLDTAKGFLAPWSVLRLTGEADLAAIAGLLVAIGHCWSVFLRFKGGKGVAVTLGVGLMINPGAALTSLLCWIVLMLMLRTVSIASLFATMLLAVLCVSTTYPALSTGNLVICMLFLMTWFAHRDNIRRLLRGEEKKFSFGGNKSE